MAIQDLAGLERIVHRAVSEVRVTDVHTHLFSPAFGDLLLWGFDELVNYHYLVAETLRVVDMPYAQFWAMGRREQADLIWKTLFVENTPYSEACRGVLTVLDKLGLDVAARDVQSYRDCFRGMRVEDYVDRVFDIAKIDSVVMTNDPFDQAERATWEKGFDADERFKTALRLDPMLNSWGTTHKQLAAWGYAVDGGLSPTALAEVRRFLSEWVKRMKPVYMAVSLPTDFVFPEESARATLIEECILPVAREHNIPFAMMIGVKRQINPQLRAAGDGGGRADIGAVDYVCAHYPDNKFMVTMLSRENQHELAVTARKFRNLLIFGCWWFLNNPSLIDEITRMRFELLGVGMVPQHSDARVLDQVIYKWEHSRSIISKVLVEKYSDVARTGWLVREDEVRRDVANLLGGNFWRFVER